MKIRNIVTFEAPHFVSASPLQEGSDELVVSCRSEIAMATFIVGLLRDKGFECKSPYQYIKFRDAVFFDVFLDCYRYWCSLGLENQHQWLIDVYSMREHDATWFKHLYDEQDATEWRAVCHAVDEVLRSDPQITNVRWFSYDELEKEDEPKDSS